MNIVCGYKNVVFDCDSTLTFIEGVDEIAKLKGLDEEVKRITHQGMNGEISFAESLYRRLSLLKPTRKNVEYLYDLYVHNLIDDVPQLVKALQFLGKEVYIATGGFQPAVEKLAEYLGIDKKNVFGVHLKFGKNEDFVGLRKNHLTSRGGKKRVLREISKSGQTLFVGDGATDLEAKEVVDLFVGFGGVVVREVVKRNSPLFIKSKSLAWVLPLACDDQETKLLEKSKFKNLYRSGYNVLKVHLIV